MAFFLAMSALLFVNAGAQQIDPTLTPMANLLSLMSNLKAEMEGDARAAATIYSGVATQCKDNDERLTGLIQGETAQIQSLGGDIAVEASSKEEKEADLAERKAEQQKMSSELTEVVTSCSKKQAVYETDAADSRKAIASLAKALEQMRAKEPHTDAFAAGTSAAGGTSGTGGAATPTSSDPLNGFVGGVTNPMVSPPVVSTPISTDPADGFVSGVTANGGQLMQIGTSGTGGAAGGTQLLQGSLSAQDSVIAHFLAVADAMDLTPAGGATASDPAFKYHSQEIISTLDTLKGEFETNQNTRNAAWVKTKEACDAEKSALSGKMKENSEAMTTTSGEIQGFQAELSDDKGSMVSEEGIEKTDQEQMIENTKSCQDQANEWDRQTKLRATTVEALEQVMQFLQHKSSVDASTDTYPAASFIQRASHAKAKGMMPPKVRRTLSFLQAAPIKAVTNFLAKGTSVSAAQQVKIQKVVSLFRAESSKLNSPVLSMMAMRVAGSHFKEVKTLLQNLIDRLLDEDHAEISKNAFCASEIAKANKDRDGAATKSDGMQANLKTFEAKKEELEAENEQLNIDIPAAILLDSQNLGTHNTEQQEMTETITTVQEGIKSLKEAQKFYAVAAKSQAKMEVDTTPSALTAGESIGTGSKAIVSLMATIMSDFRKLVAETTADVKQNRADYVKVHQETQESIHSKQMTLKLNTEDLASTDNNIETTLVELEGQQTLVDNAVAMVASLKPVCLDAGGMNHKDRVEKRNEEVAALKKALVVLG